MCVRTELIRQQAIRPGNGRVDLPKEFTAGGELSVRWIVRRQLRSDGICADVIAAVTRHVFLGERSFPSTVRTTDDDQFLCCHESSI